MHPLLERQLKKYFKEITDPPPGWEEFLQAVSRVYEGNDQDRKLIERSLEISSRELSHKNEVLRRQSENLIKIQQIAGIGDWEFDLVTNKLLLSGNVRNMLGIAEGQKIENESSMEGLFIPEDWQQIQKAIQNSIDQKTQFEVIARLKRPGGKVAFLRLQGKTLFGADGKPLKIVGVSQDITVIREAEQKYRLATKAASDVIWDTDLTSGKIFWSEGIINVFGFTEKELQTSLDWWADHIHPADKERVEKNLNLILEGQEEFWSDTYDFKKGNGEYIRVSDRGYIVRDESGKPVRIIGALTDISREFNARKLLEDTTAKLKTAQRIAHIGNWEINLINGSIEVSDEVLHILGIDGRKEPISYPEFFRFIHPDDREKFRQLLQKAIQNGKKVESDQRIIRPDGQVRIIHLYIELAADRDHRIIGVVRDVTVERNDHASIVRLAEIVESTDDAVSSLDLDGKVLSWNKAAEKLYGFPSAEIIGKSVFDYLIPEQAHNLTRQKFESVRKGEAVREYTTQIRHKEGKLIDVSVTFSPVRDPAGGITGISVIARDIGNQKRFEEELRVRTEESEKMNGLMIGRELKMIELKNEIRRLKDELVKLGGERYRPVPVSGVSKPPN